MEQSPDYKKARKNALLLLSQFGLDAPPIDPASIARELGITVNFVEFDKEHENISGFYLANRNAIYINANEYPPRMTFTIAHELGHQRLHEEWAQSENYQALFRDSRNQNDAREMEANCFAANLLVPKFLLDKYKKVASISELARLFVVSETVIRIRLKNEYSYAFK